MSEKWSTDKLSIPNQAGQLLRVRLIDGRETITAVDFDPSVGYHLRGVHVRDVAEWQPAGRTPYTDPTTGRAMTARGELEIDMFGSSWCSRH